jgi:phospholipase/lecithinase/hemolysin
MWRLGSAAAAGVGLVAGAIAALAAQQHTLEALRARVEDLEQAAQTQRQANLAHQQRLHWEMLSKAMDDPELAEVLDAYDEAVSIKKQRQFLFANAVYTNALCYYRIGNITREEFFGFARGMLQNSVFREYWYATRPHRATLDDSEEAELGRMVDDLLRQLDEADIDEWWVVGEPPSE